MKIQGIRIKDIKGTTVDQELTGCDIFIGRNGSGKSTRIQAVSLAMVGYIPGNGKKNDETFKLSTGEEMMAGLQLDGFSFDRTINRNEKMQLDGSRNVSYSESVSVSPSKGEKNTTQMKARVAQEVGNFLIAFDFKEFLDKTDTKRREFIYDLSPITTNDWNKETVAVHLVRSLLTQGLEETNPDMYEITQELINDALAQWPKDYDLTSGLTAMLAWVTAQQSIWNKKERDAKGAVRELSEIKNKLEQTDRNIAENKDDLKVLREQRTDIKGQLEKGKEIQRQWEQRKSRMEALRTAIQTITEQLAAPPEDATAKITALEGEIKPTTQIVPESLEDIQTKIEGIRSQREEKRSLINQHNNEINKIDAELHVIKSVVQNIQEKGAGVCVIHKSIQCENDFSDVMDRVDSRSPKLEEKKNAFVDQIKTLREEIAALDADERRWENTRTKIHQTAMEVSQHNDRIRNEIKKLQQRADGEKQKRMDLVAKKSSSEEELQRLESEPTPAFAPTDILEKQFDALTNQIKDLESKIDEQEKARTTLSNLQASMISGSKAQYYHAACKNIAAELGPKGIQGELVKGVLGPIESDINENLRLMGVEYPAFFSMESETGREVFQFGWVKGGRQINFDVLSTGEQLMFLSAFLVTLIERANPPVKVLALDNLENLDVKNFPNLLKGLNALSHKLDNIILAAAVDHVEADGWKVWNLTPVEAEAVASA